MPEEGLLTSNATDQVGASGVRAAVIVIVPGAP
jgi:hypothetical protein